MKKVLFFIALLVVIVVLILSYQLQGKLRSDVVGSTLRGSAGCRMLSENSANTCYRNLAIEHLDESICSFISKSSSQEACEREVEYSL